MAVNPMQRKANNSFLLGVLITLLITGAIIAFLIVQISKMNREKEEIDAQTQYAYIVAAEIKSGTEIQPSQVRGVEIKTNVASSVLYSSKVTDAEGNVTADLTGNRFPTGLKAKVNMHPGTIITSDITYEDELVANDVRTQEYNIITLISQMGTGDYIDVRLRLPTGQNYIVLSHKEITIPEINGVASTNCIWLDLNEAEILSMSSAIVEAYKSEGAMLYATKYVEPGMQEAASETYIPTPAVLQLMDKDPNVVNEAKNAIFTRYNDPDTRKVVRDPINSAIKNDNADDNLISGVEQEIQGLQEEREEYLDSLGG